ncbi:galactose mutarotase [Vagococcus sp. BWB3-3]|uniref:Aldose 1-epimerase n=1 Tax=Vagococcus allomyrinae TaxID=2794353 RepID=A0A940SRJ8_9ENTE|nr:aldose epimerase family protein [Vagococcus allomyrinae]MBP1040902.1 galactose mutarotase [Vagococcus allomyrinae]
MTKYKVKVVKTTVQGKHDLEEICIEGTNFDLSLLNYGATITHLATKDRWGQKENIVVNFEKVEDYLAERSFIGSAVGRVAGRIRKGKWGNDKSVQLVCNEGVNHLHGGEIGFDNTFWSYRIEEKVDQLIILFRRQSPHLESGYPGNLEMNIRFTLYQDTLKIEYEGYADRKTLLNPTNHTYFNLSGSKRTSILDHHLWINSANYLPLGNEHLPTGDSQPVEGTVFDLRASRQLSEVLFSTDSQIQQEDGLNHPFLLSHTTTYIGSLSHAKSGRKVLITCHNPVMIVYTGNHFKGQPCIKYGGIALETQDYPDAVTHPQFPNHWLELGELFHRQTTWSFFAT